MPAGIGIDIVKVERIESLAEKWGDRFLGRVFTEEELDYCLSRPRRFEHLAGRFAAKEALIKALEEKVPWKDIEIRTSSSGAPRAKLKLNEDWSENEGPTPLVSISHTEKYAVAQARID